MNNVNDTLAKLIFGDDYLQTLESGRDQMKRGMYETDYGNVAYVSGPTAKTAFDIDSQERIPIEMVCADKFVRDADGKDD